MTPNFQGSRNEQTSSKTIKNFLRSFLKVQRRRHETQYNDTQHNDTQYNDIQRNDTQHNNK